MQPGNPAPELTQFLYPLFNGLTVALRVGGKVFGKFSIDDVTAHVRAVQAQNNHTINNSKTVNNNANHAIDVVDDVDEGSDAKDSKEEDTAADDGTEGSSADVETAKDGAKEFADRCADSMANGGSVDKNIAKGTNLLMYWAYDQQWFEGTIRESLVQDGSTIHRVVYGKDRYEGWYNLSDPQHTWKILKDATGDTTDSFRK